MLVTGGSSGIGRATSLLFAQHGAKVVIGDINPAGVETADTIKSAKGEAIFVQADVRDAQEVQNLVATAVKTFGGLHCAFNNAGVLPPMSPLADIEESTFDQTFAVDVKGVFLAMKYEIQQMLKQGNGGAIVNMSSVAGVKGFPGAGVYVASKHGVLGLTKSAALECAGAGIRVNAVCPAVIETPMAERAFVDPAFAKAVLAQHPLGRFGKPGEVAEAVLWLCSDKSSFTTGQFIAIDGGLLTGMNPNAQ